LLFFPCAYRFFVWMPMDTSHCYVGQSLFCETTLLQGGVESKDALF